LKRKKWIRKKGLVCEKLPTTDVEYELLINDQEDSEVNLELIVKGK
jgi:hypothetical protein